MAERVKVLIVGGYGTFGGRIVELLKGEPRLTLIVAGRSLAKADASCKAWNDSKAELIAAAFDRDGDLRAQIAKLAPAIVVDASGPFQAYGAEPYRLIAACIARDVNYFDLADGSDFVAGVGTFDATARAAGLFVLSGASSFPVLTAAVVRRLSSGMARVDAIRGGIAPSPYAGVGENVIRAIASYAGQPVAMRKGGKAAIGHPLTEQMRFTIAPPGRLPLPSTLFSLVDVPDLRALAELWPQSKSIWMGAGPVPAVLHRVLIGLAWLVRWKWLSSLTPLAPLMAWATNRLRWGEHRGGMFVAVEGADVSGVPCARSWHLLAEGDDGPLIPSMAVEALVRRVLDGRPPMPGARAAVRDLELEDYERLFTGRTIYAGVREEGQNDAAPLYSRILGTARNELPVEIRAMHEIAETASGRASVERGDGLLARLAVALIGFPKATTDTPVKVKFEAADGIETWTRDFGGQTFSSQQFAGTGRSDRLLCERFGALTFGMALVAESGRLSLVMRRWSVLGVPLPLCLCPRSLTHEDVVGGRFRFHVEISHPLTGLIVRYRGWLVPDLPPASTTRTPSPRAAVPS